MVETCSIFEEDRRKVFWATQPNNAVKSACGVECGVTGLRLVEIADFDDCKRCQTVGDSSELPDPDRDRQMTIETKDWVTGLIINILQTNGRVRDTVCGVRPGSAGGHWSESFAGSSAPFGNLLHTIKDGYKMSDLVKVAAQYARIAAQKLVAYGVASKVDVQTTYAGSGVVDIDIVVYGTNGLSENVAISGTVVNNYWVWQS